MIRLVQEFGAHAGRQLTFDKARVRVGRAPDSDLVFDANIDLDASGRHCEIVLVDDGWFVVDTGSRNGTFVNGVRVQRQGLKHGDVIECGRSGPRIRVEFAPGSVTAPVGSGSPVVNPFAAPAAAPPAPAPFAAPPPSPPAPFAAPPPPAVSTPAAVASHQGGPNPFALGVSSPAVDAYGGKGGTVAMPEMTAPPGSFQGQAPGPMPPMQGLGHGPPGAPPMAPPPGGSVGQHMASSLPANAQVGKRTVALMIDQALAAQQAKTGNFVGLKAMVALLTVLVVGGLFAGAWYVVTRERDDDGPRGNAPPADPSSVGARIAAANEGNIYLLAMRRTDGTVRGFCTAFSVNENTLATNAHCIRMVTQAQGQGAQLFALRNKGSGEMIPARAVYQDARFQNAQASRGGAGYDVGLVQTEARLPTWVRLAPDAELYAVREGDGVFVYGFPGMTMNERSPVATITLGLLNRVTDFFDNVATPPTAQKLQHSAQTSGGSSGSPIFLPSGSVIGLNAGSLSDEERQVVTDPTNGQRREVDVNRGSNFKYGMRADLIRQGMVSVNARIP